MEFHNYKCNEFLNMQYYLLLFILKPIIKPQYFKHLLKYLLFIRILSQDKITKEDIEFSKILIDEYIADFRSMYGKKSMTFNLHSHLHLPNQVEKKGPLHLINCFPFEGHFKVTKNYASGTRNVAGQIAQELEFNQAVYFRDDMINFNICRKEVRNFIQKFSQMGKYPKPDIPVKSKMLKKFSTFENTLLTTQFMLSENDTINYSYVWNISNISRLIYIKNKILPVIFNKKLILFFF